MTADLQDLFDQAGKNPPTHAFDADALLLRARRAHNRRITGVVAATVAVTLALVVGVAGQRLLSADPVPAAPHPTTAPVPIVQVPGSLGRLAYGINGDIYVADEDGSNPVRIADGTPGAGGDCPSYWGEGPLWSPDGRYLAYRGDGGDTAATDCPWNRTVNISDPAGHRVASFPAQGWRIAWSPDSTRVAVWVDRSPGTKIGIYGLDGVRQALLTVPSGELGGDYDPVWAPDGTFLRVGAGMVVPVDASTPRQLPADDPRSPAIAAYSPDGAEIAYLSEGYVSGGDLTEDGLHIAAADGSHARVLIPGAVEVYQGGPYGLAWSPTGDRIAFASNTCGRLTDSGETTELCVVDIASGTVVSLADMSGPNVFGSIKFSPEGDQILFSRTDAKAGISLWSVHVDGSNLHRLVAGTGWGDWQKLIPAR